MCFPGAFPVFHRRGEAAVHRAARVRHGGGGGAAGAGGRALLHGRPGRGRVAPPGGRAHAHAATVSAGLYVCFFY